MGKRVVETIKDIINQILDIIYPPDDKCIVCLRDDCIGICNYCRAQIKRINEEDEIISYGHYGGTLKKLILSFKYKNNFLAGKILAEFLCVLIEENNIQADYIMYIPMSKKSLKKRGFNQCEIMAKVISKKLHLPIYNDLIKIKETKEQKSLNKDERQKNILGVFKVKNPQKLIGKNIILIDDVTTTGATLKECHKILEKEGVSIIKLLTVCKSNI